MTQHPGQLLLQWLSTINPGHAKCLAHLYLVCTANDLTPFFLGDEDIFNEFSDAVLKDDLPVRVATRMSASSATFELIFQCTIKGAGGSFKEIGSRYESLTDRYGQPWQDTARSWTAFMEQSFSPRHFAAWLHETLEEQR